MAVRQCTLKAHHVYIWDGQFGNQKQLQSVFYAQSVYIVLYMDSDYAGCYHFESQVPHGYSGWQTVLCNDAVGLLCYLADERLYFTFCSC